MRRVALLLVACVLAGCATVPPPEVPEAAEEPAAPSHRPNLWLLDGLRPATTTEVSRGAEPSILADKHGKYVWIGDTDGLHISPDNGTTWQDGAWPPLMSSADGWTLAQDDVGVLYFGTTGVPYIWVASSTDGGRTADWTTFVADAAPVADRPWLAAHGDGEVVLFSYDYGRTFSESCAHSTDGGTTWLDRSVLMASPQGGNAAFDLQGRFYVGSDDGTVNRFDGSCLNPTWYGMFPQGKGSQHMVQVAVDGTDVFMAAPSNDNSQVLLAGSRDLSGAPRHVVVSPPELKSNTFATVATHEGTVAVAWYGSESNGDPAAQSFDGSWNVYLAVIQDFWGTPDIRHLRLSTEPNHVGDICMGGIGCGGGSDRDLLDYFMVDIDVWGGFHVAYGHDGDSSQSTVRYAHVPPGLVMPEEPPAPEEAVPEDGPTASFTSRAEGLMVHADASRSEGNSLSFAWDWGDGSPLDTGRKASHAYAQAGTYRITLSVADAQGRRASQEGVVAVAAGRSNLAPTASFEVSGDLVRPGESVRFVDRSTDDGAIVATQWDLGDGNTAEGPDVEHAYADPGTYTVLLTVTDDEGSSSQGEAQIVVEAQATQAKQRPKATPAAGPMAFLALVGLACLRRAYL